MSRINQPFLFLTTAATLALSGCAGVAGDFPSLAKRPYEQADPVQEPVVAQAPLTTVLPAALQAQTDSLLSRSRAAHNAYALALPSAQNAVAAASGVATGSESWVNAHMILSRADSARADGMAALGAIDQLISKERESGADAGLLDLLSAPQSQIADLVNAENAEIERLAKQIGL